MVWKTGYIQTSHKLINLREELLHTHCLTFVQQWLLLFKTKCLYLWDLRLHTQQGLVSSAIGSPTSLLQLSKHFLFIKVLLFICEDFFAKVLRSREKTSQSFGYAQKWSQTAAYNTRGKVADRLVESQSGNMHKLLTNIISFMKALSVLTLAFLRGPTAGPIQVIKTNFALLLISSPVSKRTYPYTRSSSTYMGKGNGKSMLHISTNSWCASVQRSNRSAPPSSPRNSAYSEPDATCWISLPSYLNAALQEYNTRMGQV